MEGLENSELFTETPIKPINEVISETNQEFLKFITGINEKIVEEEKDILERIVIPEGYSI